TQLEFANDLAPTAMSGYLAKDPKGLVKVARLPATDDPIATRVERIRQRDAGVIDTVNGYYANFSDQMNASYGQWRRASFEEVEGRTLKLTGTAEEQYREWRRLLHELYLEENGTPVQVAPEATPPVPPVPVAADAAR